MQQKELSRSLLEAFRVDLRFFTRAIDRINKSTCSLGINVPQCHAIMEIGLSGPLSVNALSEKMNLDKSTISRQVENLVKSELVERITTPTDRRKVEISLSSKGSEIHRQMNESMNDYFKAAFEKVSKEDLTIFLKVFNNISHSI